MAEPNQWPELIRNAKGSLHFAIEQLRKARRSRESTARTLAVLEADEGLKANQDHAQWVRENKAHIQFWTEQERRWEQSVGRWVHHLRNARAGQRGEKLKPRNIGNDGWIAVSDRLPPERVMVDICSGSEPFLHRNPDGTSIGYWYTTEEHPEPHWRDRNGGSVTCSPWYWRPRPRVSFAKPDPKP